MGVRKKLSALSDTERAAFVAAVKDLKADGVYDNFVRQHREAFKGGSNPTTSPQPPAHRGPGFLPWHREFLRRFEIALQKKYPNVTLPYWDWTDDSQTALLWTHDFMGGDGDTNQSNRVTDGPFAWPGWKLTVLADGSVYFIRPDGTVVQEPKETDDFLKRDLGHRPNNPKRDNGRQLPTSDNVDRVLARLWPFGRAHAA